MWSCKQRSEESDMPGRYYIGKGKRGDESHMPSRHFIGKRGKSYVFDKERHPMPLQSDFGCHVVPDENVARLFTK